MRPISGQRMTNSDLVKQIVQRLNMNRIVVAKAVSGFLTEIEEHMDRGNKVTLWGFGVFEVRTRKARKFHNISTGKLDKALSAVVPFFRFSSKVIERVKKSFG